MKQIQLNNNTPHIKQEQRALRLAGAGREKGMMSFTAINFGPFTPFSIRAADKAEPSWLLTLD